MSHAEHALKDGESERKIAKLLSTFKDSIIANHKTQPSATEAFRFLNEVPQLKQHPALQSHKAMLDELSSKRQVEHLYVTLMRRARDFPADSAIVFARLCKTYPYLLDHENQMPELKHLEPSLFCERRALLKLQEGVWNERMSKGQGATLRWYILAGFTGFVALNVWVLWKRISFYMEHSFDILNPDIDYLIDRY